MSKENKIEKFIYKNVILNKNSFTIYQKKTTVYKKIRHLEETPFDNGTAINTKMPRDVEKSGNYEVKHLYQTFEVERKFNPNGSGPKFNPVNLMEIISSRKGGVLDITYEEYTKISEKEGKKQELTEQEKAKFGSIKNSDGDWRRFCVWYEEIPEYSYDYHIIKHQPNELKIESFYYPENTDSSQLEILNRENWKKLLDWLSDKLVNKQLTFENGNIEKDFRQEYNSWAGK